jgi:hypothetical protein
MSNEVQDKAKTRMIQFGATVKFNKVDNKKSGGNGTKLRAIQM